MHDRMATVGIVLLSLWWSGCGPEADGDVVARIDAEEITLEALRQFRGDATASYRDPEEGLKAWRFYLQTMIDMELLLVEARELQLDQTMEFMRKWEGATVQLPPTYVLAAGDNSGTSYVTRFHTSRKTDHTEL